MAVGREAWVNVAGAMDSHSLDILPVLVRGPDVSQIGEDDPALVIVRIAHEFGLPAERDE